MTHGHWQVPYTCQAEKDLGRLDPPIRRRVVVAIDSLAAGHATGVIRLQGTDAAYRLRVGDWRVIFRRDRDQLVALVVRILPRRGWLRSLAGGSISNIGVIHAAILSTATVAIWGTRTCCMRVPRSTATGIRTPVSAVRGRRPSPLDDSGAEPQFPDVRQCSRGRPLPDACADVTAAKVGRPADVAELVDARRSGRRGGSPVEVRVLSSASRLAAAGGGGEVAVIALLA